MYVCVCVSVCVCVCVCACVCVCVCRWTVDREGLVTDADYGKDEASTERLLRRHKTVETELEGFTTTLGHLRDQIGRAHV